MNRRFREFLSDACRTPHHIGTGELGVFAGDVDPNDRGIQNLGMREKHSLQFRGRDLEASHFDQFFPPIDDIPLEGRLLAVGYVPRLKPSLSVERLRIGFGILVISGGDGRSSDTQLSSDTIRGDVVSTLVNQSSAG